MEILVGLVILGAAAVFIHTFFVTNWTFYEERVTRSNLWQDSNQIIEQMTVDGHEAKRIDVINDPTAKTAVFVDRQDQVIATYVMTDSGQLQMSRQDAALFSTLTRFLDFNQSEFVRDGRALQVQLALKDRVFLRGVSIQTNVDIYPRNF
jgi:hypothetical protein